MHEYICIISSHLAMQFISLSLCVVGSGRGGGGGRKGGGGELLECKCIIIVVSIKG